MQQALQAPTYMNEDIWRRGTQIRDRTEFAVTKAGKVKMLRTWNARLKRWMWTDSGVHYYKHNRQRFIVDIPCLGYIAITAARAPGANANENALLRSTFFGQHQKARRTFP